MNFLNNTGAGMLMNNTNKGIGGTPVGMGLGMLGQMSNGIISPEQNSIAPQMPQSYGPLGGIIGQLPFGNSIRGGLQGAGLGSLIGGAFGDKGSKTGSYIGGGLGLLSSLMGGGTSGRMY